MTFDTGEMTWTSGTTGTIGTSGTTGCSDVYFIFML